jgi:tripartite-type tricarboxylate transporter receptor subunit TctC
MSAPPSPVLRHPLVHALAALISGVLYCLAAPAQAEPNYPVRPVRIVVGYTPGGATDVIARLVATRLAEKLGQPFVVDNKPGAGSNIASEEVARAKPDGYTLLVLTIQNATNMSIYKNLRYNTEKDFAPIGQFMASPSVLVLSPTLKATDLKSFMAMARAQPRTLSYASTGVGGSPHLAGEMLKARAKIDLLHVPYKGTSPALVDVMSGTVSSSFVTTLGVLPQMKAGQVRPIAVAYSRRLAELPEVPTMAEAGLPDFEVVSWNGLAAPAGTPPAVVDKLSQALSEILQTPEMQERVKDLGGEVVLRSKQAFADYVKAETAKWRTVAESAHIELE